MGKPSDCPANGRKEVLDLLHDGHPGIVKMKLIARQIVWWPRMDAGVAGKVETCQQCQLVQKITQQ